MRRKGFIRTFSIVSSLEAAFGVAAELCPVLREHAKVGRCLVQAYYKEEGWFEVTVDLTDMDFNALRDRLASAWTAIGSEEEPGAIWNPEAHWNRGAQGFAVPHIVWALLEALPDGE